MNNKTMIFVRIFLLILSVLFTLSTTHLSWPLGIAFGIGVGGVLISCDLLLKPFHIRSFNLTTLGLFFGYLMGMALLTLFNATLRATAFPLRPEFIEILKLLFLLSGVYLGVILTLRASEEIAISLPFIRFSPAAQKNKLILLDYSALADGRVIDLATTGLLDKRLVAPRFLLKILQEEEETGDEGKNRRALETIRKLETLSHLDLSYEDTDFPEIHDPTERILRLARLLDADVLTADIDRIQQASIDGVRIINIHALSNALKPLMQRGEYLNIKIQRYGKEERQGVGYLEDGTMVVVNGGGAYIGEAIKSRVLSVKHTSSGRMIFCNVADELEWSY